MFDRYLDKSVTLTPTDLPEQGGTLGALEQALSNPQENRPIPLYVNALRQLRKASQGVSGHRADLNAEALPFVSGGHYHCRRKLGYGVVVVIAAEGQTPTTEIDKALSVCAPQGVRLYPEPALDALIRSTSPAFIRRPDIKLGQWEFACLEKV